MVAKKDCSVSAYVKKELSVDISTANLLDHAICFIGDQGFYQDFAQYVIAKETDEDFSSLDALTDVDIVY